MGFGNHFQDQALPIILPRTLPTQLYVSWPGRSQAPETLRRIISAYSCTMQVCVHEVSNGSRYQLARDSTRVNMGVEYSAYLHCPSRSPTGCFMQRPKRSQGLGLGLWAQVVLGTEHIHPLLCGHLDSILAFIMQPLYHPA